MVKEEHWTQFLEKILLQFPDSKIYQEMLQPEHNGALSELWDEDVNAIVSDTVIRYLISVHIILMKEFHKVTCVCKTCIYVNSVHAYLILWRNIYR